MPCRFPSIVACETASASNSAWPAIHSSWTDWWKTINRLYILLRHSGSAALILDTWTHILGNGRWGNTLEGGTEWKLTDGKWETRIGGYMELAWSEQSVFLLSRHNLQTMNHRSGRLSGGRRTQRLDTVAEPAGKGGLSILHGEELVCLFNYEQHHKQSCNTLAAREHLAGHVQDCPHTSENWENKVVLPTRTHNHARPNV